MTRLQLITHQNWQVEELSAVPDWEVNSSFGFDVPSYEPGDAWWLPQAQAVQLLRAVEHYQLPPVRFIAPTPELLASLPVEFTGRTVNVLQAGDAVSTMVDWPDGLWWKLATAKHDQFNAKPYSHEELVSVATELKLPYDSILQYSTPLEGIKAEFRFFVSGSRRALEIRTGSGYLKEGVTVYDGAVFSDEEYETAQRKVEMLLEADIPLPPAFVVDVAVMGNEEAYILEFNPAWCSGWYNCDLNEVLEVVHRSTNPTKADYKTWGYVPDPVLIQKYGRYRLWGK